MSAQETYEATQAQQQQIHDEIKESQALISTMLPLTSLEKDFEGHDVYLLKLKDLIEKYSNLRRVRGDGNCFFRSFGFAFLENLVLSRDKILFDRLKTRCVRYKDFLINQGYSEFTVQDFAEQFLEMIDIIASNDDCSKLEELFNDQGYSDYYIVFLRLVVSAYLQINSDYYQEFIDEGLSMKQFCEREVEPMYVESDNIHIIALSRSLLVHIHVEVVSQTNSGEMQRLTFSPEESDFILPNSKAISSDISVTDGSGTGGGSLVNTDSEIPQIPNVFLLYKPGHYDILYEKEKN